MSRRFKKGAASFYIVAFSTLILMIIAMSFTAIIISVLTRASNEDLSQSAYDSALAGVEDAKLAFYNYQSCINNGATISKNEPNNGQETNCSSILWYMQREHVNCDMVGHILGRISASQSEQVIIKETTEDDNQMSQAYTCAEIKKELDDYRSTLSIANQIQVAKIQFANDDDAKRVKSVKVSWYSDSSDSDFMYSNYDSVSNQVAFRKSGVSIKAATPPTISVAMLQTAKEFVLSDFDTTINGRTNRGMVYLVPTGDDNGAAATQKDMQPTEKANANYKPGAKEEGGKIVNHIDVNGFLASNDKLGGKNKNLPYAVYCPRHSGNDFACSTLIDIPEPVNGDRSNETFVFVIALPYGRPQTDFALEFYCDDDGGKKPCTTYTHERQGEDGETIKEEVNKETLTIVGSQIEIDVTGRANDLYRRVQVRLEGAGDFPLSMLGPLELLGKDNEDVLKKDYSVTCEWNFPKTC